MTDLGMIEFDDTSMRRWCRDTFLGVHPMSSYRAVWRANLFESRDGCFWYNGQKYGALSDVRDAIIKFEEGIQWLLERYADS